jgi:hypothetical protein
VRCDFFEVFFAEFYLHSAGEAKATSRASSIGNMVGPHADKAVIKVATNISS